ncbi:KinB signaling pathway activation protein [Marininema mesophilum]|uniref:KinB signaling pathway activation protein n=1 Tax=Marininema mesophilum TaxID=1048340 RepID=A0A1H3CXQ6_9BACL|nr:KinB-signaling pathway activation protein [Marininema mesophilum]SDX58915.1 KinB signaling pathway activation protein [Marininema mesophilum]
MTLRKLFFLFWTTCLIGTVTAPIIGLLLQVSNIGGELQIVSQLWAGVMFGAMAQMGFFAYMVFNMVFVGFIRNQRMYQALQLIVTVIVLLNLLMIQRDSTLEVGAWFIVPATILIAALIAAWFKVKATNRYSFIPALFFMTVATSLEAIPALKQSIPLILLMVITLLICNAWQLMQLHRLLDPVSPPMDRPHQSPTDIKKKRKRKKRPVTRSR